MRRDKSSWLRVLAVGLVGGLLPGIFLSNDPHAHFPWQLAWVIVAPITALIAILLWIGGKYVFGRLQR